MAYRKELQQRIIEKASTDNDFRKRLIEAPKDTLEQELGIVIPNSIQVKVLEEDAHTFYLLLPAVMDESWDGELTEAELEGVSGGWGFGGNNQTDNEATCPIIYCIT